MMLAVVWCVVKDWPRLPWKTWPIQMKYCCQSDLSRPSWWLRIAAFCGVSFGPRMATDGLPGQEVDQEEGGHRHEEDDDDEEHERVWRCTCPPWRPPSSLCSVACSRPAAPGGRIEPRPSALPCAPCLRPSLTLTGRAATVVGVAVVVVVVGRHRPALLYPLGPLARRGPDRRPGPPAPLADRRLGQARRAPPLYYYLLHFWMRIFGQSDLATRSLSGVIGVITLPVAWLAGNRFGGRVVAWTTLVLLASAPFAVYYSTEARMYRWSSS